MKFFGIVEDGKLRMIKGNDLNGYIKKQKTGKFEIDIKRMRKNRSLNQNAYYWVCLEIMSKDIGCHREELHTTFRSMFLKDRRRKIPVVLSTTRLNKLQFSQYLDSIQKVASELGIILPDPEEYKEGLFMSNFND